MEFDNIVLIHREDNKFIKEGFSINIDKCFENIKSFYEENGKIFLILNLEEDFSDEIFDKVIVDFPYGDFKNIGVEAYAKDEEYYPTFIFEMEKYSKEEIQFKVDEILKLFMEKVIKIYCNKS